MYLRGNFVSDGSVDQRLQDLFQRQSELDDKCWYRSAQRVSREIRQVAKSEGLIVPYLHACHQLMNTAQALLEPEFGCEVAIEAIALLESEEKARLIQPDLPEERYQYTVQWMSACSYDNLAKHVAAREGYNSDGVHDCINDGIQICRRTGKLDCINCFREYATDVYRASDDLEMALHHARAVESSVPRDQRESNDRRWIGAKSQIDLQILLGQLDAALDACHRALAIHSHYHSPFDAKIDMAGEADGVLRLMGRHDEYAGLMAQHGIPLDIGTEIPSGEAPQREVDAVMRQSLALCCHGKFSEAADVLTRIDQLLQSRQCLSQWFEVRLRMIAARILAQQTTQSDRLAKQLLERAKDARDWLTLRRLRGMLGGSVAISPVASVVDLNVGPFARVARSSGFNASELAASVAAHDAKSTVGSILAPGYESLAQAVAAANLHPKNVATQTADDAASGNNSDTQKAPSNAAPEEEISPELLERLNAAFDRFMSRDQHSSVGWDVCLEMMSLRTTDVRNAVEAGRLIHTVHIIAPTCGLIPDAWNWAQPFLAEYPNSATLVNVVASLGMTARDFAENGKPPVDPETIVTVERLHELFRRSLDLDPERPNNFARAGQFYLTSGMTGDAERCFARAFRLDRANSMVACRLAEIYSSSERTQDALNVLDLCIREGTTDPQVFWSAAMTALAGGHYQLVVSYLERFEELQPGDQWVYYYIALGCLETGRPQEALKALQIEADRNPDSTFALQALLTATAASANDLSALKQHLQAVLEIPLTSVTYLTIMGISRLFVRLYEAVRKLPIDDELRLALEQRGLACGLAPDSYFMAVRADEPIQDEQSYFICQFEQPVGDDWSSRMECLPDETELKSYLASWGVIAPDAAMAEHMALSWQARCHEQPATLTLLELQGSGFKDRAGIAWQSVHQPPAAENSEAQ